MNKNLPVPPPPPVPPLTMCLPSQLNPKALNELSKVDEYDFEQSINQLLSSDAKFNKIFYVTNLSLRPQLQDGPKCGLVALSIATSALENFVNIDDILQTAISHGFTKQGEMFSAHRLAFLAEKCCGFITTIIDGGLNSHLCCIIKSLLNKCLLLVPYDADFNHSPCCKKGFKAHWAVISGFIIIERSQNENDPENNDFIVLNSPMSSSLCSCAHGNSKTDAQFPLTISAHQGQIFIGKRSSTRKNHPTDGKIYLIGMQGKSKHIGFWPFDEMAKSNDNLMFFSTSRNSESYVLPEGGLEKGLKGKVIILDYSKVP